MNGKRGFCPRGFTLVELLTVVAIIALLLAILLPNFAKVKELAKRANCSTNLKSLGSGWQMYWAENNNRIPPTRVGSGKNGTWDYVLNYGGQWLSAGKLYEGKAISNERNYVCPTLEGHYSPWFGSAPNAGFFRNPPAGPTNNFWPPNGSTTTKMTYGIRRMKTYDGPNNSTLSYDPGNPTYEALKVWDSTNSRDSLGEPSRFSWMADCFAYTDVALNGHVPGLNVLLLDGRVEFFQTNDNNILYTNGLQLADVSDDPPSDNLVYDNIWEKIDAALGK